MPEQSNEWKRKAVEGTPFTEEDLEAETNKLQVLVFRLDGKGQNVVSSINGTIVFVDRWYSGEKVNVGDIWLCSVRYTGTVYHAMPMKRITVDLIMGMSETLRGSIVDALWTTNRKDYEKLFEEKYKDELHKQVTEEANRESRQIISRMQSRIDTLTKQVEQTNYMLMNSGEDEIVLSSEEPENPQAVYPGQGGARTGGYADAAVASQVQQMQYRPQDMPVKVERLSEDTLYSDAFVDGRYKVYVSPNYKTMTIAPCRVGMSVCSRKRIVLSGLDRIAPFTEQRTLPTERNEDGAIVVYL